MIVGSDEKPFRFSLYARNVDVLIEGENELVLVVFPKQHHSLVTDLDFAFHSIALHFIGNDYIAAVDIVPDNISAEHSSYYFACVNAYSHVQGLEIDDLPHFLDGFNHGKAHIHDVFGFFWRISVIGIDQSETDIAISNRV